MIKNILFDWSGTLADDLPAVLRATNAIFTEYGRRPLTLEEFRHHFRLPFSGFYADLLPEATAEGLEALYVRFFKEVQDDVTLLPGAREILAFCRQSGRPAVLLSTIKHDHFVSQATRNGVLDAFDATYVEIMDKREKIRAILADHHFDPRETAFVGDMVHDIETARHGGVTSVAVLTGYDPLAKLAAARPDAIIQSLPTLQSLLG